MRLQLLLLALAAALTFPATASAHRPVNCSKLQPRAELRCALTQYHYARYRLNHPGLTHSPGYWAWRSRVAHRWIVSARYRLAHPPIVYLALWTCIHNYEGSWDNADTGHNSHYGGLQMTSPWGAGEYYVYRADWLTPYQQMRKAELGYRASGYSRSWLLGQWYHPDCVKYG